MNPTAQIDRALKDTVRKYPDADSNPLWIALNSFRGPILPPWGTRERERVLRRWYRHEYSWAIQGTIMGIITKYLASPWEVTGPSAGINYAPYFQDILREMPPGEGWDGEWSKTWLDYFRQDNGGYMEVIGPGDETTELTGRITGLANLDSLRCYPTGNPDYPVIYWDREGGRHKMHKTRILHFVDMPDGDDFNPGYGLCALSRAISIVNQQYLMQRYAATKLDDLPAPGFATLMNMTRKKFEEAVQVFTERKSNDLPPAYGNLVLLEGLDADHAPKVEITSFSEAPENFNYIEWTNLQINALALVFGIDKQEIWELSSRGLGTAAQSQTLHSKSETKTIGHMRALAERNLNSTLPRSCEFKFKVRDGQQSKEDADNAQTWTTVATAIAPIIGNQAAAKLLANQVEAYADVLLDEAGQLIRLNDADVQPEVADDQVTVDDAATANPNAAPKTSPAPATQPATPAQKDWPRQETRLRMLDGSPVSNEPLTVFWKDFDTTASEFIQNFVDLITGSTNDDINRRRAGVVMRAQLSKSGRKAYQDGLDEAGAQAPLGDSDRANITVWTAKQSQYITSFLDTVYKDGLSEAQIRQHAQLWVNSSLKDIYFQGIENADADLMMKWTFLPSEHCPDCLVLHDQVHTMKQWRMSGYVPGSGKTQCRMGCVCALMPTDEAASGTFLN